MLHVTHFDYALAIFGAMVLGAMAMNYLYPYIH